MRSFTLTCNWYSHQFYWNKYDFNGVDFIGKTSAFFFNKKGNCFPFTCMVASLGCLFIGYVLYLHEHQGFFVCNG